MNTLWQDLRGSVRMLMKKPGFTLIAVMTLALGIGANTAIFTVVNAVLLRPLRFKYPDRLVMVWEKRMQLGRVRNAVSPPDFNDWREQNHVFEDMAAFTESGANLADDDGAARLEGALVSPSLFHVLRAAPYIGRAFEPDEDQPGKNNLVILSYGLWQKRFGADPEIVGRTIRLNDQDRLVIGVMAPDFGFPNRATEFWAPLTIPKADLENRGVHFLTVVARLKPGVSLDQARAEMDAVAAHLEQQYPVNTGHGANVFLLYEEVVAGARRSLLILLGAVAFVLLIACANVANLLLARATVRQKEIAIRIALGAGRMRIVRQLLTESIMLSLAGGIIGVLLALWGVDLLLAASVDIIPRSREVAVDGWVLGFSFAISIVSGLIFGLAPALQASKRDLNEALKEEGRSSSAGFRRNRARSLFVVCEVAVCALLLIGAGLMIRSLRRLLEVSPGFETRNVLTANVALSGSQYRQPQRVADLFRQALQRLSSLPGVESASTVVALPLAGNYFGSRYFHVEGRPPQPAGQGFNANVNVTAPGYFRVMRIPLIAGRDFDDRDVVDSPDVVIINQEMAHRYWPDGDPIGNRLAIGDGPWRTVIGVVGDVRQSGLDVDAQPEMFWPCYQAGVPFATFVVRTAGDPGAMAGSIREAIQQAGNNLPVYDIRTLAEVLSDSIASRRLIMMLMGVFGGLAIVLAAGGLYGVISYSVTQRTREIGIRMALGASARDVVRLVVGQGLVLTLLGLAMGLTASYFLTAWMTGLLYSVSPTDAATFGLVAVVLTSVAVLACLVPAQRAAKSRSDGDAEIRIDFAPRVLVSMEPAPDREDQKRALCGREVLNGRLRIMKEFRRFALLVAILLISLPAFARPRNDGDGGKGLKASASASAQRVRKTAVQDCDHQGRDGAYWFGRGYQLHESQRYAEAIDAFSHSIGLGYRQATALYNVACGFALLGDKESALFWLDRAFAHGFDRSDLLTSDSDLDSLRSDPRFADIVRRVSSKGHDGKPQEAQEQKERARFDEAIISFDRLRSSSSPDGDQWYKVGSRLIRLQDFDRAAFALNQAVERLGYRGASAMYNLACAYALKGDYDSALTWLEKSVNAGFDQSNTLEDDTDIASLRSDPRFKRIQELSRVLSLSQFNSGFNKSQYSKSRWAPAVRLYESFLADNATNGRAWFNLGYASHYSREHERAIEAFQRAIDFGYRQPTSMYNIACANAMMGRRDTAFEWLDKAVDAGFEIESYVRTDPDLNSLRSDPRFERFLRMASDETRDKDKTKKRK